MSSGHGGKREGSGRKAHSADEKERKSLRRALNKAKRKHGEGWQDRLAEKCYSKKDHVAISALKLIAEIEIGKSSRSDVKVDDKREVGPMVIPELYPRPEPEPVEEDLKH